MHFYGYKKRFYSEIVIPYLEENSIDLVFDLGDTFDRRKYVNFQSLAVAKSIWFEPLKTKNIKLVSLVGNHTAFFKNTNAINTMELLFTEYPNMKIIRSPEEYILPDKTKLALLPWICAENYEESMEFINKTDASILFGHLELAGFEMYKGVVGNQNGMNSSLFSKFEFVASGHFHKKSNKGNIHYLGAPYEMTWNDFNDPRGFHVYDTESRELTYIKNPFIMFNKILYDDEDKSMSEVLTIDAEKVKNTFVKVIVKNKNNPYWFDTFIDRLQNAGVYDLQVVEDHSNFDSETNDEEFNDAEDTLTILSKYIDQINVNVDKKTLDGFLRVLYNEALTIE